MPTCLWDGCPEQVARGFCPTHRRDDRSPSSTVTGTHAWRKLKARLLKLPAYRWCHHCGEARATTLDHRVPVADGGPKWDEANLIPSCQPCNARKGRRHA